ncbi:MAG TPA: enoyl-CoA hydratase-related protein, partial [Solirubrobacterales bacterium]|nr:enoyl-CoA hydratase-related protein [Solirubrobacterales bacterium]
EAAVFGQPEIKLGIIPGFGGTQRLPRLVGANKALEMNLVGDAILAGEALQFGLANRVVPDHELFETALMWGRKLAAQAPLAKEQIKQVSANGDIDAGIEAEKGGFAAAFQSEDAKEGIGAFLDKRTPKWSGR